jgi:hypothetical protein
MSGGRLDSSQALNLNKSMTSTFRTGSPNSIKVSLALDNSGKPTIAYLEVVPSGSSTAFNVLVAQWNGSIWNRLGSANAYAANNALRAALALDGGHPVLAVEEETLGAQGSVNVYARRWDGSWGAPFGANPVNSATSDNGHMPAIALDSTGNPVVSYCEFVGSFLSTNVVVKKWNPVSTAWDVVAIGGGDRILDAKYPSIATDGAGNRFLAYSASTGRQPKLLRWDAIAKTWQQVGEALSSEAYGSPSLALNSQGVPVIAWTQDGPNLPLTYDLMLKTLNR